MTCWTLASLASTGKRLLKEFDEFCSTEPSNVQASANGPGDLPEEDIAEAMARIDAEDSDEDEGNLTDRPFEEVMPNMDALHLSDAPSVEREASIESVPGSEAASHHSARGERGGRGGRGRRGGRGGRGGSHAEGQADASDSQVASARRSLRSRGGAQMD